MQREVIALDIDDTVLAHSADLLEWYNATYGTDLRHEEYNSTNLTRWGVRTEEEAIKRVHAFYDTDAFRHARPLDDAIDVISCLAERFDIAFVTARDSLLERFTHDWLERHFHGLYGEVHFTAKFSLEGRARSKIAVCKDINASYLVDDTAQTCIEAAHAGMKAVLFGAYPWNASDTKLPDGITRCGDWKAVEAYFAIC